MSTTPSGEDSARASEFVHNWYRSLDKFDQIVSSHFKDKYQIEFFIEIVPYGESAFTVFVFFKTNTELEASKQGGIIREITDYVYDELLRAGRGKRGEITVNFEFDSDENIKVNFNDSYYIRML